MNPDRDEVARLVDALRIDAEGALPGVQRELPGKEDIFACAVGAFYRALEVDGGRLARLHSQLSQLRARRPNDAVIEAAFARVLAQLTVWTALAQGWRTYVRPATEAEKSGRVSVGGWPVVLVVAIAGGAVIALSLTGVAWAVVHFQMARNLSEQIDAIEQNPALAAAFVELNQTGGGAPPPKGGAGGLIVGLLAVAALGGIAWFTTRSS